MRLSFLLRIRPLHVARQTRTWDRAFLLLVAFPLLTGGFWLEGEGVRLEYTQAGPAGVILALWLWLLVRQRGPAVLHESWVCSRAHALWHAWGESLRTQPRPTLARAWLLFGLLGFLAAWMRHRAFQSGANDLGIFTNALSNVARTGVPLSSIKGGVNLLTDHQIFLLFPLGWVFRLWSSPVFLLILQSFALASTGVALFLLARQRLGRGNAFLPWVPLLFWLYLPVRNSNRFDFHPEVLQLPLFLFAAWLVQEERAPRRVGGTLLFLLALASKETAGRVAAGLGLAWLAGAGPEATRAFTRRYGIFAIAAGVATFILDTKLVPHWLGVPYGYSNLYAGLAESPLGLLVSPLLHPVEFFQRLFGLARMKFLLGLLWPLLFLPLLAPRAFLAALPGLLMLFLMNGEQRLSLGFHYAIEPAVGLLFALPAGLASLPAQSYKRWLLIALPWVAIAATGRSEMYYVRRPSATDHQAWVRSEVLPLLDEEASVSASSALVPHVSVRRWVHFLPIMREEIGRPVDCVLWERSVNNTPMGMVDEARVESGLRIDFQPELSCGGFSLHRARARSQPCLTRPVKCEEQEP